MISERPKSVHSAATSTSSRVPPRSGEAVASDILAQANRIFVVATAADARLWESDSAETREQCFQLIAIVRETAEKLQETLEELHSAHYYESGVRDGLERRLKEADAKLLVGVTEAERVSRTTANKTVRRKVAKKGGAR